MIRLKRTGRLEAGDSAWLFPSLASLDPAGEQWHLVLQGLVYRVGRLSLTRKFMLGLLRRALRVSREALESPIFQARIRGFLVDTQEGKRVTARVGEQLHTLVRPTRRNGMVLEELRVDRALFASHQPQVPGGPVTLPVQLVTSDGDPVGQGSSILCLPRRGLSVISDIDDTIKDTSVHCRRSMLENTFLHEFRAVSGMAEKYRSWSEAGVAFHYVSSSPWQLFEPLTEYFAREQFPLGSMHLRSFRLRDHMLRRLLIGRRPVKGSVMKGILERFPLRRFVLIGDSGEFDPEIYGTLARRYPTQVARIYIRRIPGTPFPAQRVARALRHVPSEKWRLFDVPEELELPPWEKGEQFDHTPFAE